jgi:cytochrome c-type biogenesis protein CcmH/NrfG
MRAINLEPLVPEEYIGIGEWYDRHDMGYTARAHYEHAAELMPDQPLIISALAVSMFETAPHDQALPLLERAIELKTTNVDVFIFLGDCYYELGRMEDARAVWEEGLRRFPAIKALSARLAVLGASPETAR